MQELIGVDGANTGPRRLTPVEFYDSRDSIIRRVVNPMAVNEDALPLTPAEDAVIETVDPQQTLDYDTVYKEGTLVANVVTVTAEPAAEPAAEPIELMAPLVVTNAEEMVKQVTGLP